jgi:regulator of cell morphogenesis and NO signaling
MNVLDTHTTVRDLAVAVRGATRLFERYGIDYCCGGARPLDEVCAERGIDAEEVLRALEGLGDDEPAPDTDPAA